MGLTLEQTIQTEIEFHCDFPGCKEKAYETIDDEVSEEDLQDTDGIYKCETCKKFFCQDHVVGVKHNFYPPFLDEEVPLNSTDVIKCKICFQEGILAENARCNYGATLPLVFHEGTE